MSDNRNENRETVADIFAEMRNRADTVINGRTITERLFVPQEAVENWADRIEAAWKRQEQCYFDQIRDAVNMIGHERFVKEHPPVGNAAAMRDALVAMVEAETEGSMKRDDLCGRCLEKMWDRCKHDGSCWVDKVINALSAPARNCDLNLSEKSLWDKFEDYMNDCGLPFYSEPSGEDAFDWLFAPAAAERKGEN